MDKLREAAREVVRQHSMECLSDKTVEALREALAEQAEQEPVAYLCSGYIDNFPTGRYETCEVTDYGAFPVYAAPIDAKAIQIDVDTDRIIKSDPLYLQGRAEALEEAFNAGYLAGFCSSREGYNGEYPFSDKRIAPDSVVRWSKEREDSFNKFCLDKNEN